MVLIILLQIYLRNRQHYTIESNDAQGLVESAAREIEKLLSNKVKALKVSTGVPLLKSRASCILALVYYRHHELFPVGGVFVTWRALLTKCTNNNGKNVSR